MRGVRERARSTWGWSKGVRARPAWGRGGEGKIYVRVRGARTRPTWGRARRASARSTGGRRWGRGKDQYEGEGGIGWERAGEWGGEGEINVWRGRGEGEKKNNVRASERGDGESNMRASEVRVRTMWRASERGRVHKSITYCTKTNHYTRVKTNPKHTPKPTSITRKN